MLLTRTVSNEDVIKSSPERTVCTNLRQRSTIFLLANVLVNMFTTGDEVGELDQLPRCRFRSKWIVFDIESVKRRRIADEDLGELPGQPSRGRDGLGLDALAEGEPELAMPIF